MEKAVLGEIEAKRMPVEISESIFDPRPLPPVPADAAGKKREMEGNSTGRRTSL